MMRKNQKSSLKFKRTTNNLRLELVYKKINKKFKYKVCDRIYVWI
jgi:hypothetical protein